LDKLNREESMKELERNWIGKSEGTQFKMKIYPTPALSTEWKGVGGEVSVYTTRVDTIFGMSFVAISPEHSLVDKITTDEFKSQIEKYKESSKHKTQLERTELQKEKT
jgi:leucyl-tRNA synthetase